MSALPNQLSMFDIPSYDLTPNNIIPFPTPKKSHTQQRVSPIRNSDLIKTIYDALRTSKRHGLRNATIFALQLSIGRRTNDILSMRIQDVYDHTTRTIKSTITVDEHKTGKTARDLPLPNDIQQLLRQYIYTLKDKSPCSYLFPSQKRNPDKTQRPLNTASLDGIYMEITSAIYKELNLPETHISSYAARKTYGYYLYMECMEKYDGKLKGTNINVLDYLQSLFNHRDAITTLRYIGVYDAYAKDLANDIQKRYKLV